MKSKKTFLKILAVLLLTISMTGCQTNNGFTEGAIDKAVAEQIPLAQQVDLPPMPANCGDKYSPVKAYLPKGARLETNALRLRAGLNLANAKLATANAQIERCGFWYATIREGYNQPPAPLERIK